MTTALISVSNKIGLVEFASDLQSLEWDFLASGGTARALKNSGISVSEVADYTGSPEILNGRVKTLHPAVAGGILAQSSDNDQKDLNKINAGYIDLVVCNLYPFQDTIRQPGVTLEEAIENIDIGGVTLIRAAAKNHQRVTVCTDPKDYPKIYSELRDQGQTSVETRRFLAHKAFTLTAEYDAAIRDFLKLSNA
jgi:phosphoribosylaminoimidazolecarboxamide formyltransferase/IMP cyclohydrolase